MSIKLKTHMRSISILNTNIERLMLHTMLWSFLAFALLYILLLGNMVFNIVERRTLETDMRALTNDVGSLELSYISMSNNINLTFSHSLGFKETKINFAIRKSLGYSPVGETSGSFDSVKMSKNEI